MRDVNEILSDLDSYQEGFRPTPVLCAEAAERIRYLSWEMRNAGCVVDRLKRDKIILRDALIKLVGVSTQTELEQMKKAIGAMLTLGADSDEVQAALAGINALLDVDKSQNV